MKKNVSHVIGQNSLIPQQNNNLKFSLARDKVVHLETAANCVPAGIKNTLFVVFFYFWAGMHNKTLDDFSPHTGNS